MLDLVAVDKPPILSRRAQVWIDEIEHVGVERLLQINSPTEVAKTAVAQLLLGDFTLHERFAYSHPGEEKFAFRIQRDLQFLG